MIFLLAVLGALPNATVSVLQRKAAGDEPDVRSLRPSMILDLVQRRVWLGGIFAVIAGFLLLRSPYLQGEAGRSEGSPGQAAGESSDGG